ncbi:MAG: glycosyltransferase family 39 protein [Chloroflexi bacterium]|nr:glycosyltransferase family 39 protein [Chloroflexota bacterium]
MEILKALLNLRRWHYLWLLLIVVFTLVAHFIIIAQPPEPLFDEQHYVPDARSILKGEGTLRLEHPPLGKLMIAAGISIFGDNAIGWRAFSILFGTAGIVFFYLICRRLTMTRRASLLATFLLALDNLTFVQASVAMLDVYSVTFMLAAFWLYLKGNYPLSGVLLGLSTLAKLNGALALPAIALHWALTRQDKPWKFTASMVLAPLAFVVLLPVFNFIVLRHWTNPIDSINTMLNLSSSLTFASTTHPNASRPWMWILRPEIMPYWYTPHYIGAISFTIWGLIVPAIIFMVYRLRRNSNASFFGLTWFVSTYLVWIPLSLLTNRISFIFYFYPTVGAICIGIASGLCHLINRASLSASNKLRRVVQIAIPGYLLLHLAVFIVLTPLTKFW